MLRQRNSLLCLSGVLFIIVLVACGLFEPMVEVKLGNLLIEYPGVIAKGPLYWSPDDSTLIWQGLATSTATHSFYLTDTNTLKTRNIEGAVEGSVVLSSKGDSFFYYVFGDRCWHRYSLTTGENETLLCNINTGVIYISPDGIHLAYEWEQSIYLYNLTTQQTRFLTKGFLAEQPFSPDGSQLLVVIKPFDFSTDTLELAIVTIATGAAEPMTIPNMENVLALYWTSDGIMLFGMSSIRNVTTGKTYAAWQGSDGYHWADDWSWSANGHKVAFPTNRCLKSRPAPLGGDSCVVWQYHLNVQDLVSGKVSVVAKYGYESLGFSLNHDGTKIAYYLTNMGVTRIYVDKLPD